MLTGGRVHYLNGNNATVYKNTIMSVNYGYETGLFTINTNFVSYLNTTIMDVTVVVDCKLCIKRMYLSIYSVLCIFFLKVKYTFYRAT